MREKYYYYGVLYRRKDEREPFCEFEFIFLNLEFQRVYILAVVSSFTHVLIFNLMLIVIGLQFYFILFLPSKRPLECNMIHSVSAIFILKLPF